ncbi:MAG: histidine kinase [Suipraeoptans sp.]
METISDIKLSQLDSMFENMESVTTYLLSDQDVLEAIGVLSETETDTNNLRESNTEFYFQQEVTTIRSSLKNYYMLKEFNKIIIFSESDNVVSNDAKQNVRTGFTFAQYPWIDLVNDTGGKGVIIGQHEDIWNASDEEVISLVREIQMPKKSYVEVQINASKIEEVLSYYDDNIYFLVTSKDGKEIYSTNSDLDFEEARGDNYIIKESENQDFVLLTVNHTNIFIYAMGEVLPFAVAIFLILIAISFIYIYYASIYLSKPVRQLQHIMENTELANLGDEMEEKISNDEIESLYISYKDVLSRLNESVVKEKNMSILQMQAQFDLLQAQVNPHFIYNVLNVISERGMALDDEVICDVCSDLSKILRYSTNTKQKYATIREEIDYLSLYLQLLKFRYHDKLQYEIGINQDVYNEQFPKIVLQQLVENCVIHGYRKTGDIIKIDVCGCMEEDGWIISIRDYGDGMPEEKIDELNIKMNEIKDKLSKNRSNVEMEIGGMGLVNTFARLYLLFGERLRFEITNKDGGGTQVEIFVGEEI